MNLKQELQQEDQSQLGRALHGFAAELYPICRSITGAGIRETLGRIQERIPLQLHEVPSGTPVFDWTVPQEWNIRDAYIKDAEGIRIVDFHRCNLHVFSPDCAEAERHLREMVEDTDAFAGQNVLRHVVDQAFGTTWCFAVVKHVRREDDLKFAPPRSRILLS